MKMKSRYPDTYPDPDVKQKINGRIRIENALDPQHTGIYSRTKWAIGCRVGFLKSQTFDPRHQNPSKYQLGEGGGWAKVQQSYIYCTLVEKNIYRFLGHGEK